MRRAVKCPGGDRLSASAAVSSIVRTGSAPLSHLPICEPLSTVPTG